MTEDQAIAVEEYLGGKPPTPANPIWLQWDGEPDAHYGYFLIYLALGNTRSIDRAYQINAIQGQEADAAVSGESKPIVVPTKASSTWFALSTQWHWPERAARYDVFTLSQLVPQTVQLIFATIGEFAKVTLEQLQSRTIRPEQWSEVRQAVETLAGYISPEIIQATVQHASNHLGDVGTTLDDPTQR